MSTTLATAPVSAHVQHRARIYQIVLGFNMTLHLVIGLACMFAYDFVTRMFGLPGPVPPGWENGWGATLILVTALYVPGLLDPLGTKAPNIIGVGGRVWMATVWFVVGGGFFWFGVFDLTFAIIIGTLYAMIFKAE
jgi:hypothetical protein